jgi:hypothetical protein
MLTVGLAAMFKGLILLVWGGNLHTYPEFLPPAIGLQLGAIHIAPVYTATLVISIVFLVIFGLFFKNRRKEYICVQWPTIRKPRFRWVFMFAAYLHFPGQLPP